MKQIRLTLKPLPDGVPPEIRLRRVLKSLLRTYGMRAVRVEWDEDEEPTDEQEAGHPKHELPEVP